MENSLPEAPLAVMEEQSLVLPPQPLPGVSTTSTPSRWAARGAQTVRVNPPPSHISAPLGTDKSTRGKTLGDKAQIYLVFQLREAAGCCVIFDKLRDAERHKFAEVPASS